MSKLFKHMSHTYKISKIPYYPSNFGYTVFLYTKMNCELHNMNLNIFTNKIIDCAKYDLNLEEYSNNYKKNKDRGIKIEPPKMSWILDDTENPVKVIFPPNSEFATYQYTFKNLTLNQDNTFIIICENYIEPMKLEFSSPKHKNQKYTIDICEKMLPK